MCCGQHPVLVSLYPSQVYDLGSNPVLRGDILSLLFKPSRRPTLGKACEPFKDTDAYIPDTAQDLQGGEGV